VNSPTHPQEPESRDPVGGRDSVVARAPDDVCERRLLLDELLDELAVAHGPVDETLLAKYVAMLA